MFLDVGLSFVLGSYDAMHYYQKKKKKKANKGKLSWQYGWVVKKHVHKMIIAETRILGC